MTYAPRSLSRGSIFRDCIPHVTVIVMRIEANAIKVKNLVLAVLCGMIVPISRVLDHHTSSSADSAAWLTPLAAALVFVPYVLILVYLTRKYPDTNLSDINIRVLGKFLGTAVNIIYMSWFVMLSAYYLCKFGERMSSTVFYNTDGTIFIAVMLVLLSFSLRLGQEPILRACCMFFFVVSAVFIVSLLCMLPKVHMEYHLPVTVSLVPGICSGGMQIFSVLMYFTAVPFFFGNVKSKHTGREISKGGLWALALCLLSIFVIVGVFSAPLASQLSFPFFSTVKEIVLFESVERIEAIIVCVMILSDFALLALFAMCCSQAASRSFKLKNPFQFELLLMLVFAVSLIFGLNSMRLNDISFHVIIPSNLAVGAGMPALVAAVSFIRSLSRRGSREQTVPSPAPAPLAAEKSV